MKNVLLVNPFGIGDVLFCTPLLRALRGHGVARIDVILGSRTAGVLKNNPCVDEVFSIPKDELKRKSKWSVLKFALGLLTALRERKYDTLVDLSLTREYAFWSLLILGIRRRVGFDFKGRGGFLTERVALPEGFGGQHVLMFYRNLAERLGLSADDFRLQWILPENEESSVSHLLKEASLAGGERFFVVGPGGGASWGQDAIFKQWAPEKFARVASFLGRRWGISTVFVVGGREDKELAKRFAHSCALRVIEEAGSLTLGQTAALFKRSQCFLGNDGGLLHMAKAVDCATVSFFGPVDPEVYGPYPKTERDIVIYRNDLTCRPCYKSFRYNRDCEHRACLTELDVDEAIRQLEQSSLINFVKAEPYASGC